MGNLGAFITLNGKDMKPKYTTYEAVVRISPVIFFTIISQKNCSIPASSSCQTNGVRTKLDEPHIMSVIDKNHQKFPYDVHHVIKQIK